MTLVSVCAVAGLLFLLLAVRRLRHRRFGACAIHGTSSLVLFLAAVAIGLLGVNLLTYHRLTHEQPALEAQFKRAGDARYAALLTYPSGETQELALAGDEWQVDARVLKWRPFADLLGFDTAYRLERISGRYTDIARERDQPSAPSMRSIRRIASTSGRCCAPGGATCPGPTRSTAAPSTSR